MKNGFSEVTPIKQKHLKLILETHIACTCAILKRYSWADQTYYYFDINAGPGIDPEGNPGSPLIFLNMATKIANRKFFCVFIEKDLECYLELMENIKPYYIYKNLKIITRYAKHEDVLPEFWFAGKQPPKYGLIYADPFGLPSFDTLGEMSAISCYQRTDILINCPATVVKRSGPHNPKINGLNLTDSLEQILKKYWIIREPYAKFQWTFLLGTNWINFPSFKKIGMYRVDTTEGSFLLNKLNKTRDELREEKHENDAN